MTLPAIGVLLLLAALYILLLPARWRGWTLFLVSLIAVYVLQPRLAIRWLDYSLPTLTLGVVAAAWWFTRAPEQRPTRDDAAAFGLLVGVALLLTLPRYLELPLIFTSRPPPIESVILAVALGITAALLAWRVGRGRQKGLLTLCLLAIIALFILVKTPPLTTALAGGLRASAGQDVSLALPNEIGWLGFSYIAFRLIHLIRDRQTGILPTLSLREAVTFTVFFPAITAGPIDRAERFIGDYRSLPLLRVREANRITIGLSRIAVGLFKKFVIADSLALFSLNAATAAQATSTGALWINLYAYAFQLYFDFSGYTDIAIGIAYLFGILLPENFNRPYLKPNIAAFWQSWHISLSDWVRFYVYSPLSRRLIKRKPPLPNYTIIFICTLLTMVIIGLWHGVTLTFFIWGVWHALGLFAHKWWTDRTRKWYRGLAGWRKRVWTVAGILLTFHFVVLGWVWFTLPDVSTALRVFAGLAGVGVR